MAPLTSKEVGEINVIMFLSSCGPVTVGRAKPREV